MTQASTPRFLQSHFGFSDRFIGATAVIPSLASIQLDSEETRDLLQRRISLLARVSLVFGLLIQAVARGVAIEARGNPFAAESDWTPNAHLLVLASFVCIWLRTRRHSRSEAELAALDIACLTIPVSFSLWVMWLVPPVVQPDLINLLVAGNQIVLRAVLLPSSGRRTAALSTVFAAALVVWAYAYHSRPFEKVAPPLLYAATNATWCAMFVIIATVASHTVFGLRARVREATRLGQYTLLRKIGEGGMGEVYEARHALLRRRTAVKLLPPAKAGEQNIVRFEREVQLTSSLTHPNTVSIYDYGRSSSGVFYYAMEYLDGIDLQKLVDSDGPQPDGLVVQVLEQVCGALAEAHSIGLIHRDIKPANVILCERAGMPTFAKVVDFGLVKRADHPDASAAGTTGAGAVIGTPLYMSPESITNPDRIDARSDLYAVGALGYFLLTGQPVFRGATVVEIYAHHLHSMPVRPSESLGRAVPLELEAMLLECLSKVPERRPPSAAALAARLATTEARALWTTEAAHEWRRQSKALQHPRSADGATARRELLTIELEGRDERND